MLAFVSVGKYQLLTHRRLNFLPASCEFCRLLIIFTNSLDPD